MKYLKRITHLWLWVLFAGVLFAGAPVKAEAEEVDHSGEAQIHKPASVTGDEVNDGLFVDDSTDNTYGYYTIMGETTVSLSEMTSLYESQNVEYP